jgi:DNA-directed RNA polymerase subunit RPC12/RpoP
MTESLLCPQCSSKAYKRNGYTRHGKQNYRCLDCGRQFSHEPAVLPLQNDQKLMEHLLSIASASTQSDKVFIDQREVKR